RWTRQEIPMEAVIVVIGLLVLAVAAWRWGFDSTDGLDSPEWERRRAWRGFGSRARKETTMEFAVDILAATANRRANVARSADSRLAALAGWCRRYGDTGRHPSRALVAAGRRSRLIC